MKPNRFLTLILPLVVAVMGLLPIWLSRSTDSTLLRDSDTAFLLMKLDERKNPMSWFTTDWPLENHFYRPVSTLVFEYDHARAPGVASAFAETNALLCIFAGIMLFWLVSELWDRWSAAAATLLFGFWIVPTVPLILDVARAVPWLALGFGLIRAPKEWQRRLSLAAAASFALGLLMPIENIWQTTVGWIPGRTATSMAIFFLAALAAYVRFERLGSERNLAGDAVSSTDLPATRTTVVAAAPKQRIGWLLISVVCTAMALGCYEQAVMIPPIVFLLGMAIGQSGRKVRWHWQMAHWAVLIGYLILRVNVVATKPSGYQLQQFRKGPGVLLSMLDYVAPSLRALQTLWIELSTSFLMLFISTSAIGAIWFLFANGSYWVQAGARRWQAAVLTLISAFAYAPMAFLKQFGHYHFVPMALATLPALFAVKLTGEWLMELTSPAKISAPERAARAPGALPST